MTNLPLSSIKLTPRPNVSVAKGYPHGRSINRLTYFDLAASAFVTQADIDAMHAQFQWGGNDLLTALGLLGYVLRYKRFPSVQPVDCSLYNASFEAELKPLALPLQEDSGSVAAPVNLSFWVDASGDLWVDTDTGITATVVSDDLVLTSGSVIPENIQREGDSVLWLLTGAAAGYYGMQPPLRDSARYQMLEQRAFQEFSSGYRRLVRKSTGQLLDIAYKHEFTLAEARDFIAFWLSYDHQPLLLPWISDVFGSGKRFMFAQDAWELSSNGGVFDLSVKGYVI